MHIFHIQFVAESIIKMSYSFMSFINVMLVPNRKLYTIFVCFFDFMQVLKKKYIYVRDATHDYFKPSINLIIFRINGLIYGIV